MLKGLMASPGDKFIEEGSTRRFREMVSVLRRRKLLQGITPVKIREILEDLGPTFVKLGQIMSMRPDFLPQDYCDELMKLQASVTPLPFATVREILEKEYRCHWDQIFLSIDEEALGSASIAQVHRAVLKNGDRVVIKVQRPGIYDIMSKDIVLLKRAAALLQVVSNTRDVIDFAMILDEMWTIAKQEMDFLIEASHMDEFRHLNAGEEFIACPRVNHRLTTPRVLVMEYIDGIRFDDFPALEAKGFDRDQLGRRLGENYVRQIVEDGYFHADPHPGNIWIQDGKIVWLDLGMMGRLSRGDRAGHPVADEPRHLRDESGGAGAGDDPGPHRPHAALRGYRPADAPVQRSGFRLPADGRADAADHERAPGPSYRHRSRAQHVRPRRADH